MRRLRAVSACLALLVSQACMASTVVLHVRPDGSGRATITTRVYLSGLRAFDAIFAPQGTAPQRAPQVDEELPPPNEGALRRSFGTSVKVASTRLDKGIDGGARITEVDFDDIRQVQMQFPPLFLTMGGHFDMTGLNEAPLLTFSIRPHENGDRLLVVKLPNPSVSNAPDAPVTVFQTDSQEERLIKQAIKNMAVQLFVELEQPVLRSNAPRQEGNRATILNLDLDRMINAMDEPRVRRIMMTPSFQEMLWQVGDLPGAIIPTESEVFLEYEGPPQQPPPPPAPQAPPAPARPDSEIYLARLATENGRLTVGVAENITNHVGYDNQPFFTPDGRSVLFTSERRTSPPSPDYPEGQTDIYRYDIAPRAIVRATLTPESEYSPTPMLDGVSTSTITVEADGTQRLWSFAPSGPKIQRDVILQNVKPVGYHAWADDHTLALFILGAQGAPSTLQLADTKTGTARIIATDIGRSILRMPGSGPSRHISFVQRERAGDRVTLVVKELDSGTGAVTTLTPAVEDAREADLAWTPDGTLLMAKDDVLYAWRRGASGWNAITSPGQMSLRGITRIAVSQKGDLIALVAQPAQSR